MANRRALRPDRQIYRQLRQIGQRRFDKILGIEIAILVIGGLGLIWLVKWLFF